MRRVAVLPIFVLAAVSCGAQQLGEPADVDAAQVATLAPVAITFEARHPLPSTTTSSPEPANARTVAEATTRGAAASGTVVGRGVPPEVRVFRSPDVDAGELVTLTNPRAGGTPLVFQVITVFVPPAPQWLEVRLPIRPNGTTGWVRSADLELSVTPYRIEIDTSEFRLDLYRDDRLVSTAPIGVGRADTPTPYGEFFLAELIEPTNPAGSYGPYAFGLSGFSDVLTSFKGGEGIIGIHGTDRPDAIGTEVSHGCIRVDNEVIAALASEVPLGTPVVLHR